MKKIMISMTICAIFLGSCLLLTACGNSGNNYSDETPNTSEGTLSEGTNSQEEQTGNSSQTDDTTQRTEGIGESIMDGAEDIADGAANMVEDLTNMDFTDYQTSHDYLLDHIAEGNAKERYEVREKERQAVSYDKEHPEKKAYRYEVYDTTADGDDSYGVFYVDQESGQIFREDDETEQIKEYQMNP